jgi:hypothetical protein
MSELMHIVVDNTTKTNFIQNGNTYYVNRNVGIGKTNPTTSLDVSGSINASGKIKENNNELLPLGSIMLWSGSIETIPGGWILCDGNNGTPDMRNRFVVGASDDSGGVAMTNITGTLTKTGGNKDSVVPSHNHTGTVDSSGDHFHRYLIYDSAIGHIDAPYLSNENDGVLHGDTTSTAGLHNHTFTTNSTGTDGTNANLPPYYALAYIMKNI